MSAGQIFGLVIVGMFPALILVAPIFFWGLGCVLLVFIGIPAIAIFAYTNAVDWFKGHLANPGSAPIVAVLSLMGVFTLWFAVALRRMVRDAASWPVTRGRIVSSD